jgi:hypothetical protein
LAIARTALVVGLRQSLVSSCFAKTEGATV